MPPHSASALYSEASCMMSFLGTEEKTRTEKTQESLSSLLASTVDGTVALLASCNAKVLFKLPIPYLNNQKYYCNLHALSVGLSYFTHCFGSLCPFSCFPIENESTDIYLYRLKYMLLKKIQNTFSSKNFRWVHMYLCYVCKHICTHRF